MFSVIYQTCSLLLPIQQYITHISRYQHERAIAQGGYGLLLTRWDKRASAGQELLNQSDVLLQKVPTARLSRDDSNDSGSEDIVIPLTGMLQLPL